MVKILDSHLLETMNHPGARSRPHIMAADLVEPLPTVYAHQSNAELTAFFAKHPLQSSVAVLGDTGPLGLIGKARFFGAYARLGSRDGWSGLPCGMWVTSDALVADAGLSADALVAIARSQSETAFEEGFVATRHGQYLGLGTPLALLKAELDLERHLAEQDLAFAAFAQPLLDQMRTSSNVALAKALPDHEVVSFMPSTSGGDDVFAYSCPSGTLLATFCCLNGCRPSVQARSVLLVWLSDQAQLIAADESDVSPGQLLARLDKHLRSASGGGWGALASEGRQAEPQVRMGLVWLPRHGRSMRFAGAQMELLSVTRGTQTTRIYAGSHRTPGQTSPGVAGSWLEHHLPLEQARLMMIGTPGVGSRRITPYGEHVSPPLLMGLMRSHAGLSARETSQRLRTLLCDLKASSAEPPQPFSLLFFSAGGGC